MLWHTQLVLFYRQGSGAGSGRLTTTAPNDQCTYFIVILQGWSVKSYACAISLTKAETLSHIVRSSDGIGDVCLLWTKEWRVVMLACCAFGSGPAPTSLWTIASWFLSSFPCAFRCAADEIALSAKVGWGFFRFLRITDTGSREIKSSRLSSINVRRRVIPPFLTGFESRA